MSVLLNTQKHQNTTATTKTANEIPQHLAFHSYNIILKTHFGNDCFKFLKKY